MRQPLFHGLCLSLILLATACSTETTIKVTPLSGTHSCANGHSGVKVEVKVESKGIGGSNPVQGVPCAIVVPWDTASATGWLEWSGGATDTSTGAWKYKMGSTGTVGTTGSDGKCTAVLNARQVGPLVIRAEVDGKLYNADANFEANAQVVINSADSNGTPANGTSTATLNLHVTSPCDPNGIDATTFPPPDYNWHCSANILGLTGSQYTVVSTQSPNATGKCVMTLASTVPGTHVVRVASWPNGAGAEAPIIFY